jgi:hypothetical protein
MRIVAAACLGISLLAAGQANAQLVRTSCTYRWQSSAPDTPSLDPMIKVCREVDFPSHAPMRLEFSSVNKTAAGVCVSQVQDPKYPESDFALMLAFSERCPPQNDPRYIEAHRVGDDEFLALLDLWRSIELNRQEITRGDFERGISQSRDPKLLAKEQFGIFDKYLRMGRLSVSAVAKIPQDKLSKFLALNSDYSIRLTISGDENDFYVVYVGQTSRGLKVMGVGAWVI